MVTEKFNLIDEDWIPVLMADGSCRRVSLQNVFTEGSGIADLSLVAYERISVMRLLICIAMAAMDENDLKDEKTWRVALPKIGPAAQTYLRKWHDRFNFFGDHAFMQPDGLTAEKPSSWTKLYPHRASGNNGTLFDHFVLLTDKNLLTEDLPLGMLTYLNYSAGGRHAQCIWDGIKTEGSVSAGPCREKSMAQTFFIGDSIIETIWLNLITNDMINMLPNTQRGRPFWECETLRRESIKAPFGAGTLAGRLVPLSRVMKFSADNDEMPLGEGLKYSPLPETRETMATVVVKSGSKKGETYETYVSVSEEERPWRNLKAILSLKDSHGTLTLNHIKGIAETNPASFVSIWNGGLVADQAKDVAVVEWRTSIPASLVNDLTLETYQAGVDFAKDYSDRNIYAAARTYCEMMKLDGADSITKPARLLFWEMLNHKQPMLQKLAFEGVGTMEDWKSLVRETARKAFESACPHATGRQLEAYVKGLGKLNFTKEN